MFYCAITKQLSKPGDKPIRLTTERRMREYVNNSGNTVGRGWEIVTEINVTLAGLREWCQSHPEDEVAADMYGRAVKAEQLRRETAFREGKSVDEAA